MSATSRHSEPKQKDSVADGSLRLSPNGLQRYAVAILCVGVALGTGLLLQYFHFHVPGALLLFAVAIVSWYGGLGPAVVVAVVATVSYYYFFVEPVHTFYINRFEIPYFIMFILFAALLARFGVVRRRIEAGLRSQADLLNLTHDSVFVATMEGVIKYWNRGAEQRYGWTADQAVGTVTHDLLKTVFPAPLEEIRAELARTGRWEGELRHSRKDGTQVIVASRWALQRDEHGAPIAILETNNDITERRCVEETLHENEIRFRTFVDHAADAFFVQDEQQQGKVVDVNRQACDSLGYTREELIGMSPRDFDPNVDAGLLKGIRERVATGEVVTFESRHQRKDGTTFPVELRIRPLWLGTHRFHLSLARDITERKRAEEKLQRLNRELRAISSCNQALLRASDEQTLLNEICRIVCEEAGYRPVFVSYVEHDEAKSMRPVAWAGTDEAYLTDAKISWSEDTERGRGPTGTAVRSGNSCYVQDFATDPRVAPWRETLLQGGFRSAIALPLKDEHANVFGTLAMHSERPNAFTPEEIRLLEELAADLAFGIITLRSQAARNRAEEALRDTAAQWQATFDAVQDLVLLLDNDFRILRANHAAVKFMGLPLDKIVGGHCYDLIHGAPASPAECPLAKMRQSRRHEEAEVLARKGGPWLSVSVDPLFNASGELMQVVHVARDITDRKQAESALRRSETYLADAHRLTHTGAWATDINMQPLYWSEEAFRAFGLDPQHRLPTADELLKRVYPEDRDKLTQTFGRAISGRVDDEIEFRTVLPDGTVKHIHVLGRPVLNDSGEVVEVVGTSVDITERKRAEESLRENEVRFRTFVDHAADALFIYSDEGTIVDVNESACQGLGYTRQELIGRSPDFFHLDSDREELESVAERALAGENVFDTHWHRRKDGTTFPVEVSTSCYWHGGRRYLLKLARDISDRLRAEEAIRKSEKQLRDVIDTIPAHVWSALPDGSVEFINRRILEFSGMSLDHAIGEGWKVAIHPDDRDHYLDVQNAAVATGQTFEVEARLRRADGQYRWMLFRSVPLRDETGKVIKRYGVSTDIDDRKRAEQALKRSEAYLTEGQRLSHTGSWAWSPATHESLYWSEEMLRMFAFDPQEGAPTAEAFWHRVHPDDLDRTYELLMNAANGNMDYEHEHRIVLPNGTVKHIHAIGHPVLNDKGQVTEYVGTAMDVTERKRAEEALHDSETRFRTFVDHAADAFFMLDFEQGTIVDVNRTACESLGFTRQELIGNTPLAFDMTLDEPMLESLAGRAAAGETVWFDKHWHRRKDGSQFPVEINATGFWHRGRRFLLKVARDITDRVRAEEQREKLRELEADLAHINRVSMLGELTASIAHEVNQPLAGIVGNASAGLRWLAADVPNLDEAREGLRRIVRDGKRAAEIIARTRALTKKTAVPTEKLDVNETIRQVLALLRDEAKKKSVVIETQFADGLSPVSGDRVQLQQVVLNLVMNAIEAMSTISDRGRKLLITTQNVHPDQVQVTVADSGVGLDPNAISKIFDPFYTTKPGGMGMGLSISSSIVQAHGGRLWATTKDGPGTAFHFTLPRSAEEGSNAETTTA